MDIIPQLKLLIKNPIINDWERVNYLLIDQFLGIELRIPPKTNFPFLFSTFVLSIDGKLHYPNDLSGYGITQYNHHATSLEKFSDKFYLLSSRTIADAIIIGSRSLNIEKLEHFPIIEDERLKQERIKNGKPLEPTIIVICRNLNKIDFTHKFFTDPNIQVFICCFDNNQSLELIPSNFKINYLSNLVNLDIKNLILIDEDLKQMFLKFKKLGFKIIMNESPFFHHQLLEAKLLDEIWLNYSLSYIGGATTSLGDKQKPFLSHNHPESEILTLHHIAYNFLYSRQKILYQND